ncbi:MAG TPA: helix-hairpin-helix domain-containing protein [Desulfobulbus sp.]|nr:helix-hairpin-helix domain-containing protein [Desulfobulbus sp.]
MKKFYLTLFLLLFLATAAFAKVNINTADAKELATLPGIGQVKAEAIVKYRKDNGKFKNVNDLKGVKGIGDKIIIKLKPEVTTGK